MLEHSCTESNENTFSCEGKKWVMKDFSDEVT